MPAHRVPSDHALAPWQIPDPGNGAVIAVRQSGQISIVTAGSETNTVAAPSKEGIELTFEHMTDGGARVITFPAPLSAGASNTVITLTAVRDAAGVKSVRTATGFRWQLMWIVGATLS